MSASQAEDENCQRAEEAEVSAIAQAERVPKVAGHAEGEADVHRDPREKAEERHLRRRGMEVVLEHVGGGNVEQDIGRDGEDNQRQRAEVEKEPLILRQPDNGRGHWVVLVGPWGCVSLARRGEGREQRLGCIDIYGWAALRAKIRPDEAEPEGCGGSTVEGENEVWPDFHPSDKKPSPGTRICAATRRDGAIFPQLFVSRR